MRRNIVVVIFLAGVSSLIVIGDVFTFYPSSSFAALLEPTPTPGRIATEAELHQARAQWERSAHSNTFDQGMGANTTCARCKAPRNWDAHAPAAQEALDCSACKRIPGTARPELASGVPIKPAEWKNIGCDVCHQPAGNSFYTSISFWNNSMQKYEPIHDSTELCERCHEGRHGFEVLTEQKESLAHKGWACTRCHGPHGGPIACTDCHNPNVGKGVYEHSYHTQVNCTACHDAGGLSVALEQNPASRLAARHQGTYITIRFAHTLTAWPSHNIQTEVDCRRCHHPRGANQSIVATRVGCDECHKEGAALFWCTNFPRNPAPDATPAPIKK